MTTKTKGELVLCPACGRPLRLEKGKGRCACGHILSVPGEKAATK